MDPFLIVASCIFCVNNKYVLSVFVVLTCCGVATSFASLQHGVVSSAIALTALNFRLAFVCSLSQPVLALLLEAARVHALFSLLLSKLCCVGAVPLGDDHRVHPQRSLSYLAFNSLPRATRSTGEV